MWFTARIVIAVLIVAGLAAAGFAELVLDIRAPRSILVENHAFDTDMFSPIKDFDAFDASMRTKYGVDAVTTIQTLPLRWVVEVDDKVVHEELQPVTFGGVTGLFVIGSRGRYASLFAFRLDPQEVPPPRQYSPTMLRNRFKSSLMAKYLDFNDADVVQGPCVVLAPSDFGLIGTLLRLNTATYCIIDWRGKARASILVGAVLADGDPWMRPFTQRICRSLTSLALRKIADARPQPPEYAACILVDRPTHEGSTENSRHHVYEVGPSASLALIEPPKPRAAATAALASPK
jgi:hypothetical protein